jgi:TolB-like protein
MKKFLIFILTLTAGGLVFAETVTLDTAIREIADYIMRQIERQIEGNSAFVISNIDSEHRRLSKRVIDGLTEELTRDGRFKVAERDEKTRAMLVGEMQFQEDGYVSEDTQKRFGREMGAGYIISGEIALVGDVYHLTVKVNHLESGLIIQPPPKDIKKSDKSLTKFLTVDESWKEKKIYFGGRVGGIMNMFDLSDTNSFYEKGTADQQMSFNGAAQFAWHMNSWASIQVELLFFTSEMNWAYEQDWQTVNVTNIAAPLLFKPAFWVGKRVPIRIAIPLGVYLKFGWGSYKWKRVYGPSDSRSGEGELVFEAFGGASAGLEVGLKAGPGVLFLDARYFFDGGRSRLGAGTAGDLLYNQSAEKKSSIYRMHNIMFSLGYALGF